MRTQDYNKPLDLIAYFQRGGLPDLGKPHPKAGYRWSIAGENIAKGQATPADVMRGWMKSPGHAANVLNCGFRNIGIGVAADTDGSLLWTQDFATAKK